MTHNKRMRKNCLEKFT